MSTSIETVVDLDASTNDAPELAQRVTAALLQRSIRARQRAPGLRVPVRNGPARR